MIRKIYIYFLCISLILFYIWADRSQFESLQNYDNSRKVKYNNMYNKLTNNKKLKFLLNEKPKKPFRSKYFKSNLNSREETQKDFAYFNNATSIISGHNIF